MDTPSASENNATRGGGGTLAIIPCSKEKIWDVHPQAGPTPAGAVYISPFHEVTRRYAEQFADRWVILSALHGFLEAEDLVPEAYDVTFDRPEDPVIGQGALMKQVEDKHLMRADRVIVVCGDSYTTRVVAAFEGYAGELVTPLAGLEVPDEMTVVLQRQLHVEPSSKSDAGKR